MNPAWQWQGNTLLLNVHTQPRASRDEITGVHGDALKIRITAPPVDGKANAHLQKYLAEVFGVPRAQVELLHGETGRRKQFRILDPVKLPAPVTRP